MKKKAKKLSLKAAKALCNKMRSIDVPKDCINPLKLKRGDRVSFLWVSSRPANTGAGDKELREEFRTKGYVMKVNKIGVMCRFPCHRKAKQIRYWPWLSLSIFEDKDRLQRDVIGQIKKIVGEK